MTLAEKLRSLREMEGSLRGLGRAMTQGELLRALQDEGAGTVSQSYLSQIESGKRPHLTNTTRLLLARFFRVHPGYLVEDPEGYTAELRTPLQVDEDRLDLWLIAGSERFEADAALCRALRRVALADDTRGVLLLLARLLEDAGLRERVEVLLGSAKERDDAP